MSDDLSWVKSIVASLGYVIALSGTYYYLASQHVEISDSVFFVSSILVNVAFGIVLFRLLRCSALYGLLITPSVAVVWGLVFYVFVGRKVQIVDEGIGLHIMLVVIFGISLFAGALVSLLWEKRF